MIYLFWFLNVVLSLAISTLAALLFVPTLKKLLTRSFSEDIQRGLLRFAVAVIFIAGLSGGGGISNNDIDGFRWGMWRLDILFIRFCAITSDILVKVAQALACVFIVAVAAYVLSAKRAESDVTKD